MADSLTRRERPKIGDRAMFYLLPDDGIKALGMIIDIRRDEQNVRTAFIAVLGWPQMEAVPTGLYHEKLDGIWRSCAHPRGFNAAGGCFDCWDDWGLDDDV